MTKILNLDTFEVTSKTVTINGKEHQFHPLTVERFLEQTKKLEETLKDEEGEFTLAGAVEQQIEAIVLAFPTIKPEDLRALPMEKLGALVKFARDTSDDDAGGEAGNAQGEGA